MRDLDRQLQQIEFVAPSLHNSRVVTRIGGIVYKFAVPARHPGVYEWQATGLNSAKPLREIKGHSRLSYLSQFPQVKLLAVLRRPNNVWAMVPWNTQESLDRFGIQGMVEVHLGRSVEPFDIVEAALTPEPIMVDHARIRAPWIPDLRGLIENVAGSLETIRNAAQSIRGVTPEALQALDYIFKTDAELKKDMEEQRIRMALGHMSAELLSYIDQDAHTMVVRWKFQGIEYRTVVQKDNLEVVSAGICLSGRDRKFDLTSLVSVMKERQARWGDRHYETYSLF